MKKKEIDSHSYDAIYVGYLVDQWIHDIVTNMHVRHVKVTKDITGMTVTLEALSFQKMPEFDIHD